MPPRYGSDLVVDLLKSLGIEYVALNPGSSFRGIHDSLVNYESGRRPNPEMILCCHEEIAVAVAHGYAKATGTADPLAILRDAYRGEPFVHVGDTPPETKWATGSNAAFLSARYDERTGTVVALSAIDNLGKGAAGQMIQCANLMLGLDEGAGLEFSGLHPL